MIYEEALADFHTLPHVDNDQLDGSISHLVFRAQHELDILHEGEWPEDVSFTIKQQYAIRGFINKYGTKEEIERMQNETPCIIRIRAKRKA